jgi:tetratricopeptide (TPR) repeat protein
MGVIKKTRGKFDQAIQFFNKAIKINPNNVTAYCNISNTLLSQGKYKESIIYCDKALEINKYNPNAYFHKSLALLSLEKFKEGWLLYESRKKIYPYKKWQTARRARTSIINIFFFYFF